MKTSVELAITLASLGFLTQVALSSFSYSTRKRIWKRDRVCQHCGATDKTHKLECSHKNHERNRNYNSPSNGELLCLVCHLAFHEEYQGRAGEIGLSESNNNRAITSIYNRMEPWDKSEVKKRKPHQLPLGI